MKMTSQGDDHIDHHAAVHELSLLAPGATLRESLAAISLEFGLTVHSLIIGLAMATANDERFKVLLVALCFHQFFEGVGLGARLAEASMSTSVRVAFAAVFGIAAPIGIGAGISLVKSPSFNSLGSEFLLSEGSLDGVCAGVLLYLGFQLMGDFARDLSRHADGAGAGWAGAARRVALFVALWGGAGAMAGIGRYL